MKKSRSPKILIWIFSLMQDYDDRFTSTGDFTEFFNYITLEKGRTRALLWGWYQIFSSFPSYLIFSIYWRIYMLFNHIKVALRNLSRNKLYSFINVFGLAIGIAICLIISLWVQRELSYDRFHANSSRVYRVERELFRDNLYSRWPIGSGQYKQLLMEDHQEIESAVRFWRRAHTVKDHNNFRHRQVFFAVDNSIFDIFDFGLEEGNEATALTEPNSLVLTRKNAKKYFGTDEVIGRSLAIEWGRGSVDFKVTGILKEVPQNSHIQFNMLISIASYSDAAFASLRSNYLYIYLLAREGTSRAVLEEKLKTFVSRRLEPVYGDLLSQGLDIHEVLRMHLFPITKIHLYPAENWELEPGGSMNSVYIFSTVAIFILILACINFINLSTSRARKRAKEVSLRKTVGAGKSQLRAQFIQESTLAAFIAFVIALLLCLIFIPVFKQIFTVEFSAKSLIELKNLLLLIAAIFAVGILSGLYPAFYLTRFEPAVILKGGSPTSRGRSGFRKNMVVFQFVISTILIFGMLTVFQQMRYIKNRSLGFNKDNMVVITTNSQQIAQGYNSFREELLQNTQITAVSASADLPGDSIYGNGTILRMDSNEPVNLIFFSGDFDYINTLEVDIIAGRGFSRDFSTDTGTTVLLNQAAAERIGWRPEEAVGKRLRWGTTGNEPFFIVGVVNNFNFKSLRTQVEPIIILLNPAAISTISIRIQPGNIERTLGFIRDKWQQTIPGEQFNFTFLDSRIQELYEKERKMQNLFTVFALLSILVAGLGLFGLSAYTAEVKTKEIGIRKTLGASNSSVTLLLSREFFKWILLANAIALPAAWYLMSKWLQDFAYRINIGFTVFVLSGLLIILLATLTFIFQVTKAARANPVDSLRYE